MRKIIGHQKIWQFLKKSAEDESLSHAYLFWGEEHLGKKTLALEFIKFLNKSKNFDPDLIFISGEEKPISISKIREIQYFLSETSFLDAYKSVLIDHAERMTKEAQSSLLKTLEEPKGKTLLILVTPFPNLLIKTITSRCQKIYFSPVPSEILREFLENHPSSLNLSPQEKEELISSFRGRPGKLINFLSQPEKLEKEKEILKEILSFSKKDLFSQFEYLRSLENKNINSLEIIKILIEYFRGLLIGKSQGNYSLKKLKEILEFLNEIYFLISFTNINEKLALEMLILKL